MEIWKDVVWYEGVYEVSNFGNTRRINALRVLKPTIRNNYLCVDLCNKGNDKTRPIHQLVAESFIDKDYKIKGLVIDHIDGDKFNNNSYNLRAVTQRENSYFSAERNGLVGVYRVGNRYNSKIQYNGISVNLGCFVSKQEANNAHKQATIDILNNCFSIDMVKTRIKESQKYNGLTFRKDIKKWSVFFKFNKKKHRVGVFLDKEIAYAAMCDYKKANGIEF